jgi:hypothetical protein
VGGADFDLAQDRGKHPRARLLDWLYFAMTVKQCSEPGFAGGATEPALPLRLVHVVGSLTHSIPAGVCGWRPQNDEFIALVKQWTKDELANDDFFSKVGPPLYPPDMLLARLSVAPCPTLRGPPTINGH